jgi:hypothetical protein
MEIGKTYETEFVNKTDAHKKICEYGRVLMELEPGQTGTAVSTLPTTTYARFSKVVFEKDGSVSVKENQDWEPPALAHGQFATEILNIDGAELESMRVNGEPVQCYKGIPRLVYPTLEDPLVYYKSLTFRNVTKKVPALGMPEYLVAKTSVAMVKEPRSKRDCQKIKSMIEDRIKYQVGRSIIVPRDVEV